MIQRALGLLAICFAVSSCAGVPPIQEYNLAAAAIDAAKKHNAPEVSPGYWARAETHYRRGQRDFDKEKYSEAKEDFKQARLFAERAENATVLKKSQNGGSE